MTQIPDWYFVCIINSELISLYVDNFINNTSHFQINDARQLPIIIPTDNELKAYKTLIDSAIKLKKDTCSSRELIESQLAVIQESIDESIERLFKI
jgi:restriction endonuclease S subunit